MSPAPIARHGRLARPRPVLSALKLVVVVATVLAVSVVSVGALAVNQLRENIVTVALPGQDEVQAPPPGVGAFEGGFNVLFVGSDECDVAGGCPDREGKLNDFTMLLHVTADHQRAVAVSFPRDLLVPIPACPRADGSGNYPTMSSRQINTTLGFGGLPCTVLTVSALTGLDVPYAGIMTFNGVREISSAIGGVSVCIDGPINDRYTGLNLPTAGEWTLEGEQALDFLRTRHGVGDGSDIGRIGSQQMFLSSMLRKIKADSTLADPGRVFQLATAASKNMIVSESLAQPTTLVSMALVFKDLPLENVTFVQYPAGTSSTEAGRVVPIKARATELFAKIAADQPIGLEGISGVGTVADPAAVVPPVAPSVAPSSASGAPTAPPVVDVPVETIQGLTGQTAADRTCSKAND